MPKILVIDDDESFRDYMMFLLERNGYEAVCLRGGGRALAAIGAQHFDAIVTDLYMPEADGIEIIRTAKEAMPTVPILGVTGGYRGLNDPCSKAMVSLGANAVFTKPLDASAFLRTLRDALPPAMRKGVE
jgi:CheY-like chemotaxis protein